MDPSNRNDKAQELSPPRARALSSPLGPQRESAGPPAVSDRADPAPPALETAPARMRRDRAAFGSLPRVFASERAVSRDALGRAPALARLAALLAHQDAEGPMTIGVLGAPGAGKSHALDDVLSRLESVGGRIVTLKCEAGDLQPDPATALARLLHPRLARALPALEALARERAAQETLAPQTLARAAHETLSARRAALETARRAREVAEGRRARLPETILYEAIGAQFESYVRTNRSRIEPALRAFGFTAPESLTDYRGLVLTLSETHGPVAQARARARALWAYRGQMKRLGLAAVLFALSWGLNFLARDRGWLAGIEGAHDFFRPMTAWIAAHVWVLADAGGLAFLGGLIALGSVLWRGWRFSVPLWRGARLLTADVQAQRGALENTFAHHAQRVDELEREVDALALRAAEADRRAGGRNVAAPPLFAPAALDGPVAARAYLAAVDRAIASGGETSTRIVVGVDGFESLSPVEAQRTVAALSKALAAPGFALVVALDPEAVAPSPKERQALSRLIHVPFTLPAPEAAHWPAFVRARAEHASETSSTALTDSATLDAPLTKPEREVLVALAALAGPAPRNVARLVNLYRLARDEAGDDQYALAVMLALALGGAPAERAELGGESAREGEADAPAEAVSARLADSLAAATAAQGRPVTRGQVRRAAAIAARWTL